jgi:transcription initiation factor TFIIE subunit alpha
MATLTEKEIDTLVSQLTGEEAVEVVRYILSQGENVSEFLISESLEIPINAIRNMLYRLQENNLITFTRKKDKKKGWYIYYWTFNHSEAQATTKRMKENRIFNLRKRLEREDSSQFYTCSSKCLRVKFDNALESSFRCPECTKVLKEVNNSKIIREIKKELSLLEEIEESSTVVEATA